MPVLTRPVVLPRALLLQLWDLEGLGGPHPVLGGDEVYVPEDSSRGFTRGCLTVLTELGLAREGALNRDFRAALRLLAFPSREVYCWSTHADPSLDRQFLVSAGNGDAVGMQVSGDTVAIAPVDDRSFVHEFAHELPEFPAARVRELVVPRQDVGDRDRPRDMFASAPDPARELAEQMRLPRDAMHQVYAAATIEGRHQRSLPLSVIDIRGLGRMLVLVDGQDNLHRLPGTPGNLAMSVLKTWESM